MTWIRLDDKIRSHPKILKAGPEAAWLWVAGLSYCADHLTDGVIPAEAVSTLGPFRKVERLVERLLAVKLWTERPDGGGYAVHDFLDYNPRSAEVRANRDAAKARMQRHRSREQAATSDEPATDVFADPDPTRPVPDPSPGGTPRPPEPPEAAGPPPARLGRGPGRGVTAAKGAATWAAYAEAYTARYGVAPVRNGKTNALLAQLVDRLGAPDAPAVAAWYVGHAHARYVAAGHAVWALVQDAEKLRTEWATGRTVTATQARQADRLATTGRWAADLLAENQARRAEGDGDAE